MTIHCKLRFDVNEKTTDEFWFRAKYLYSAAGEDLSIFFWSSDKVLAVEPVSAEYPDNHALIAARVGS